MKNVIMIQRYKNKKYTSIITRQKEFWKKSRGSKKSQDIMTKLAEKLDGFKLLRVLT